MTWNRKDTLRHTQIMLTIKEEKIGYITIKDFSSSKDIIKRKDQLYTGRICFPHMTMNWFSEHIKNSYKLIRTNI